MLGGRYIEKAEKVKNNEPDKNDEVNKGLIKRTIELYWNS